MKKLKLEVSVGESWPECLDVGIQSPPPPRDPRNAVVVGMAILLGFLLVVFTIYGMVRSESMLESVFELVRSGLSIFWAFALGRITARAE